MIPRDKCDACACVANELLLVYRIFYVKHESNVFKPVTKLKREAGEFSDLIIHLLCQRSEQLRDIFPGVLHSFDV